jgi:hypothetical protein
MEFALRGGLRGFYAFNVGAKPRGAYAVQREECFMMAGSRPARFRVEDGRVVQSSIQPAPAASRDRLYLVNASGVREFRPLYDALSAMGFYNLNPEAIRDLQPPDPGERWQQYR